MTRAKDTNINLLENLNSGRFPAKRILMPLIFALVFFACLVILVIMFSGNAEASYGLQINVEAPKDQPMDTTTVPQSAVYSIRVHNPGTSEESINLTISFQDPGKEAKGWTVNPNMYTVNGLGSSATEYVSVTVTAPANIQNATANEVAQLTVYGYVVEQPSLFASDTFIARVTQIYENTIEVKDNDNAKNANQGGTVTYTFIVTNTGNGQDTIDLSVSGMPTDWVATFTPSSQTINRGVSFEPQLTLTLNTQVKSTVYPINVIATSQGDPSETGSTSIFTTVNPEYQLSVSVSPSTQQEGLPGSIVQYVVTVENQGNIDEQVIPGQKKFGLPWTTSIDKGQQTIPFQSSKSWTLSVSIPDNARDWESGKVNFTAKSKNTTHGGYDEIQTITEVGKVYGIDVYIGTKTNTTDPGYHVYYTVQITNIGNTNDTITLSTSGDFASSITPNKLTDLSPDTPTNVNIVVTVPSDALAGFHVNTITATSEDKVTIVSDDITTEVNPFYDIILLPSGASSQDGEPGGAPIQYQVRIRNEGTDEDTISLTLEGEKPTWAALDRYLVNIPAKGYTIVNLTIEVPSGEPINNWAVVVNGTSTGDPDEWDIANFEIRVLQTYEVTVSTGDNSNSAPTGSSTKYYLNVKNTGSGYDDFTASAWAEDPIATTWASISPPSFGLSAAKNTTIVMTITIPTGTDPDIYIIWFNITSDNESKVNYDVRDSLKTLTEVTQSYSVLIAGGSEQSDESPPKTTISYQIEVWNTGTGEDSFIVEKVSKPTSNHPSWAKLSHNFIQNLMPDEKFILFVNISIPEDTKGDTEDYLKIIIKSDGDPSIPPAQSFVWINTTIIPERDAVLTPHTDIFYREPGDVLVVTLQLTNTGTAEDTLTVEDVTPEPYDTWGQIALPATLSLGAGNYTNMTYTITVDQDVTRAESPIKLNLVVKSEGADDDIIEYKNITIYINQTYGVRISSTQSTKTGDPGEELSFKIKVTNEGNDIDTFAFTDFGDELGVWSHTDYDLGPDEFVEVYYNITIDSEHDTSDIIILLKATSVENETANDTLELTIHVDPRYEVKLGVDGSKFKEVFGGKSATFNLTIQNKGTAIDTYDIEPVESLDFEILASDLTISLNPNQITTILFTVTPREGTDIGAYDITINVTSQNDSAASQEYTFIADVQASYGLFLSTTTTNQKVAAGDDAVFTGVKIKNEGNDDDTYTFFLTGLPPAWSHDPISDINVPPGDTVSFDVTIHTDDASPSGLYEINLTGRSVNDPSKEKSIKLIVEVEQVYGVSLTATTTAKTGDIEETLLYLIQVKNTGNGEDYIELTMTGQHTEFASFYYNNTENGPIIHVRPPPGGTLGVYLNVTLPSNYWDIETQNQFTITAEAESLDDPSTTPVTSSRDFITTVNPVYGVNIISGGFTSGEPGEAISFLFEVKNDGTVSDSYNIRVEDVSAAPGGDKSLWFPEINFNPTSVNNLAKGATQQITMFITIPDPSDLSLIPPGIYNITVELSSSSDTDIKDVQVFDVNVKQFYWADVQNTVTDEDVNVGETVEYTITIKNKGNDVDELSVELEGDPDIPGSVNWGKLTHTGSNQTDKSSLTNIQLAAGESTDIVLKIAIPDRTDPAYPTIDPDDVTLIVKVEPGDEDGTDDEVTVTADINIIYEFDFTFLAKTLDVEPGDAAEFTINVENKGTASETFTYEIYQWDKDWSAFGYTFIPSSGNLQVGAGNIGEVTLTINTPSDLDEALSRDYNITIKVHSSAGDIDVFKNCTIHIDPVYDVEITTTGSISKAVNVGNNVSYQFSVRNTGNSRETFPFTISDEDTSANGGGDQTSWADLFLIDDLTTPITSVELDPDESVVLILNIKVPNQGDPNFAELSAPLQMTIEVTAAQDESAKDSFMATTTINAIYDFELSTTAPLNTKEGKPGDSISFTLQARNAGTASDTYKFRVSSVDEAIFTVGTINEISNLGVDSYGSTTVSITITDENEHALEGTYQIEITGESDKEAAVVQSIVLNVEITASAEVEITPASQADSGEPGDVIDYKVKISNKGNAIDTFDLTLSGTYKDWGDIYDTSGTTKITQVTLNATTLKESFVEVILRVTIPDIGDEATTAGQSYPITIKAASTTTEGVDDTGQVTTTVDEYIDLILEYSGSGEPIADFDPNENQPKFRFKVTNNGNIDETGITVNVDDMPTLWNAPTIDFIDILEPGKSTTFSIVFNIPSDEDEGEFDMQISVSSSDGSEDSDPVYIIVNITKPDLSISESDVTGLDDLPYLKDRVGSSVTIRATIYNVGHSKAEKVQVKLYEDGTVRGTKTISSINAESSKNVDFRWTVVAEEVEMKVEVTPLEEIDDGNNQISPIYLDLRPDLSFDDEQLNFSKSNPAPNEEITITAFIKNDGGNVEDVAVKFYYGTKVIGTKNIDIDYDETAEADVSWKVPDEPGKKLEVKAEIDKSGAKGDGDDVTKSVNVESTEIGEIFSGTGLTAMGIGLGLGAIIFLIIGLMVGRSMGAKAGRRREGIGGAPSFGAMEKEMPEGAEKKAFKAAPGAAPFERTDEEEAAGEEEERAKPKEVARVRCPKCGKVTEVTSTQRPLQIPCDCGTTLMLKK